METSTTAVRINRIVDTLMESGCWLIHLAGPLDVNTTLTNCTLLLVLAGAYSTPVAAGEAPVSVEVFTDSNTPVVSVGVTPTIYVMDAIAQLQHSLSEDLPTDPAKAKALALARLQRLSSDSSRDLENAATGLLRAQEYGLNRYPALVFDGQAIVYGVTDLGVAQQHYARWRGRAVP